MKPMPRSNSKSAGLIYDQGTMKVVFLACIVIIVSIVMTGAISYGITKAAVLDKLKTRDLVFVIESMAAKVDGRIERAKEVSLLLAADPAAVQWVAQGETNDELGGYAKQKITDIAGKYDYSNAFIVSALTKNYWEPGFHKFGVMEETNPHHAWFFNTLKAGKTVELNIEFDPLRGETFVFVNALMRSDGRVIGVAGVGLVLRDIVREFQEYTSGERSKLWLVDHTGKIHLAANEQDIGLYLNDFMPSEVSAQILSSSPLADSRQVMEYYDRQGQLVDMVYCAARSTEWKLVYQLPRQESIALLDTIKLNTGAAGLISLIFLVFLFYFISNRIANPFKRAVLLTQAMEKKVQERTQELQEKNQKIMDSIDYAQRIQEAVLPAPQELREIFPEYFIIWQPRDGVGGDFYWSKQLDNKRRLFAVADCTGHGVPGAFMTMMVNSILNHLDEGIVQQPAEIIRFINRQVQDMLYRHQGTSQVDDGLDIGICYMEGQEKLVFAGAKIGLTIRRGTELCYLPGDRHSIGYRKSRQDFQFTSQEWHVQPGDCFYLTTDGYVDQNGGMQNYSFGRRQFSQVLLAAPGDSLQQQEQALLAAMQAYRGEEPQRDDITVVGFTLH